MRYVELDSFLYGLSLSIPPEEWNTSSALQWAISASRRIGGLSLFTTKTEYYQVENHTLAKPDSLRTLNQFEVYIPSINASTIDNSLILDHIQRRMAHPHPELFINRSYGYVDMITGNPSTQKKWKVLYKSNGHFINTCDTHNIKNCVAEYIDDMNAFRFSFKSGVVGINYLAYAESDGHFMIPDIEDYKLALETYVSYKIYEIKARAEPTQFHIAERNRLAQLYSNQAIRAIGKVNEAALDTPTMESIKNIRNRLVSGNQYASGFQGLGKPTSNLLF